MGTRKPPNEKSFEAKVYSNGQELPEAFDDDMPVLIAAPVEFEVEYRCFILNRAISTMFPYFRHGRPSSLEDFAAPEEELCEARRFAELCLADDRLFLPRAVVLDVGRIRDEGWAVVEANAAWGSGIYGCDPQKVLQVIRHAVEPA